MMKQAAITALCLAPLTFLIGLSPAFAVPAPRTFLANNGNDANTCSVSTTPCLTLQGALAQTSPGGEVDILTPGDFKPATITFSVTVRTNQLGAAIYNTASIANGITINAADTDTVVLQGLDIYGNAVAGGAGVKINQAGAVYVIDSTIRNFGIGIYQASTSPGARALVQRSNILRNDRGAAAGGQTAGSNVAVLSILDSLIDGNNIYGIGVGGGSIVGLARSVVNASPTGIFVAPTGGLLVSIGPSNIVSGTGDFSATVPFR